MKKIVSFLLIFIMVISLMQSCADNGGSIAETTASVTGESETAQPEEKLEVPENSDYGGYIFNIYTYEHSAYIIEHVAREQTGDLVNDAIYERNRSAEELFDIKINPVIHKWENDDCRGNIRKSVMAADEAYDLFSGNSYNMSALSTEGLFKKLSEISYINVDKPWWNRSSYEELSVGSNAYLLMGDLSISNYGLFACIYFNKSYIADYNIEDPYEIMKRDEWTIDTLISLSKDIYSDVDSNNKRDETDLYGMYSPVQTVYDISNHWLNITTKNADNYPDVTFYNEKTAAMFDKLKEYFVNSTGVYAPTGWTDIALFNGGNSVFVYSTIGASSHLRDMESDYGLLPIPKYDSSQKEYRTNAGGLVIAIPATASDTDRTGMVTESLAYYGRKLAYPAYVETAISIKGTRDEAAQESLEIILNSANYNFGTFFSGFSGYGYSLLEYFKTTKGFGSFYESYQAGATKELNDYANLLLALE
ncbi:MAG: hypothetical protein ACYCWE_15835 [Eubacteriales bacterium]